MTATTGLSYGTAPNQVISADNGIDYTYREIGAVAVPLVLLQHFRGNLENWDFQLVDALASRRRVVAFDNVGVGGTTGTTPNTIAQMARDAIAFIATQDTPQVRKSLSTGRTWYGGLCWPRPRRGAGRGCMAGHRR
jgi:pimeloyl-ACP methyl ester carboxylesterase